MLRIKRAYEPASKNDGTRILVERLWPRGINKTAAKIDIWPKDIAPSTALRNWFGHEPGKWGEFRKRYRLELKAKKREIDRILACARIGHVTLIYAARDQAHNSAIVLAEVLEKSHRPAEDDSA